MLAQSAGRAADLLPIRHGRMAASPWTYFRGAAAVMAADLASRPNSGLTVQLCGDAHVLNFGLWATPERQLSFDLRDFDETLPGPFEWDVMRMLASLQVLGSREDLVGAKPLDRALRAALEGYRAKIADYADARFLDIWYDQITAEDLLDLAVPEERADRAAKLHKQARKRSNTGAAKKFSEVVDGRLRLVEAPPFRVHDPVDLGMVEEVFAAYRASLPEERRYLLDRYSFVDVVRQVVGVGSVGMRVFLVLLRGSAPRRPAVPADQAGRTVGVRGLPPAQRVPQPRPAGDRRPAVHPELDGHLRRLDAGAGDGSLRPSVPRHEGHPVRRGGRTVVVAVRPQVRPGARPGPRQHG